jgi:hypothetical protein
MSKGRKVHCLSHLLAPYSEAHRTDCDMQQTFPFSVRCAIEEHKVNAKDRTRVETERKKCLLHNAGHAICVTIRYARLRHATNSPCSRLRFGSIPGIQDYDMQQTTLFLTAMCVKIRYLRYATTTTPHLPNCDMRQDLEILNCDIKHDIRASWDDSKRGKGEARLNIEVMVP